MLFSHGNETKRRVEIHTVPATQRRGHNDGGEKFTRSSLYSPSGHVAHSYSSGSLGELQFGNTNVGPAWTPPNRSQTRLHSRRSQSREDLVSSMAEGNTMKP
ncbi:apyrase [Salvia divinorum]|uniref:Apyrase n=1 Tax=Salvia divinorum TaxID=28513 RepID=A0ABD1FUH1_SALDI